MNSENSINKLCLYNKKKLIEEYPKLRIKFINKNKLLYILSPRYGHFLDNAGFYF